MQGLSTDEHVRRQKMNTRSIALKPLGGVFFSLSPDAVHAGDDSEVATRIVRTVREHRVRYDSLRRWALGAGGSEHLHLTAATVFPWLTRL